MTEPRMNLEAKFLDGPSAGYCSSSDEEDDSGFKVANDEDDHQANVMRRIGGGANTGAKGVLEDFKDFKEQQKWEKKAREQSILREAGRGMLQGTKEDREKAQMDEEEEDEDDLEVLRRKRLAEMRKAAAGMMLEIQDKDQFLKLTEGGVDGLLCVLIYEPGREDCEKMTHLCKLLAASFPKVKFSRATATTLGMSARYIESGLPTLQFYSKGSLVGNFVKITDELGLDCSVQKILLFLKSHNIRLNLNRVTSDSELSDDE